MSYRIAVYRRVDEDIIVTSSKNVPAPKSLYENPIGAGDTIYRFWSTPAFQMKLPLLAQMYKEGLKVSGSDLNRLNAELEQLENYWKSTDLEAESSMKGTIYNSDATKERFEQPIVKHLKERAQYLREAIEIALAKDGVIFIS
jgi:hypothetical protein